MQVGLTPETIAVLREIPGGDELLAFCDRGGDGGHGDLGDSEIESLVLDREAGARLTLAAQARTTARIVFHLSGWIDVTLQGFSGQNVIGGFQLRRATIREWAGHEIGVAPALGTVEIVLEACAGGCGSIRCDLSRIEIVACPPETLVSARVKASVR